MSLTVVHINRNQDSQREQQVKELAERLMEKWKARDLEAVRKIMPGFDPDKEVNTPYESA